MIRLLGIDGRRNYSPWPRRFVVSITLRPLYTGEVRVTIVQEAECASRPVWTPQKI